MSENMFNGIDFSDLSLWGMEETRQAGKPLSNLTGDAATWFVDKAAARNNALAVESPAEVHAEYAAYATKDVCASVREQVKRLAADLTRLAKMSDADLSDEVMILANQSRTGVSARLAVRPEGERGQYASASVSVRLDGSLKASLSQVAPAAQPKGK